MVAAQHPKNFSLLDRYLIVMNPMTRQIFINAFSYLVSTTKFYTGLARENRQEPSVHAAQLRKARENAREARQFWVELRAAGVKLRRSEAAR